MSKIKKIWNWFVTQNKKLDEPFYGEDANGKMICYPWMSPGEAFYFSERQKVLYTVYNYALGLGMLVIFSFVIFLKEKDIIDWGVADLLVYGYSLLSLVFYFLEILLISKTSSHYLVPFNERENKSVKKYWMLFFVPVCISVECFVEGLSSFNYAISFVGIVLYIVIMYLFVRRIKKTKGYIFNK